MKRTWGQIRRAINDLTTSTAELKEKPSGEEPVVIQIDVDGAPRRYVVKAVEGIGSEIVVTAVPEPEVANVGQMIHELRQLGRTRAVQVRIDGVIHDVIGVVEKSLDHETNPVIFEATEAER